MATKIHLEHLSKGIRQDQLVVLERGYAVEYNKHIIKFDNVEQILIWLKNFVAYINCITVFFDNCSFVKKQSLEFDKKELKEMMQLLGNPIQLPPPPYEDRSEE